jgi:DNA-binding NarL/FixJ family response regulator
VTCLGAQYPSLPVVVVSANDDPAVIRRCIEFGAPGFIPKTLGLESRGGAGAGGPDLVILSRTLLAEFQTFPIRLK